MSIATKIAQRQLANEKTGGKVIFSFATREAALLELCPALGASSRGAEVALSFAETVPTGDGSANYPKFGAKLAHGEVTAKTARFVRER